MSSRPSHPAIEDKSRKPAADEWRSVGDILRDEVLPDLLVQYLLSPEHKARTKPESADKQLGPTP